MLSNLSQKLRSRLKQNLIEAYSTVLNITDWYQVSFTSQQITTEMMIRYKFIYLVGKVIVSDFTVYSQEYNG